MKRRTPKRRPTHQHTYTLSPILIPQVQMNRGLRQPRTTAASDETWGGWGWVRWVVGWVGGVLIDYGQLPTCAPSRPQAVKRACPLPVPQVESAPADDENTEPDPRRGRLQNQQTWPRAL